MINLSKALDIIDKHILDAGSEIIPLKESYFRILGEDVFADRDIPPFNKSAMDGFACRRADLGEVLSVTESIQAGAVPNFKIEPGTCARIMTGAKVPEGADCVIMQEYTQINEDGKMLFTGKDTNTNICYMGEDIQQGELVLKQGNYLNPQNVGLLAAIGKTEIKVFSKYSIGIIATGSELVEPWDKPERTKIRNSNAWQLMGQIHNLGHIPIYYGIVQDDSMLIRAKTEEALNKCDILFLTGGASVGEFDLVASVLESLEFSIEFDRLAIQPGKPVTFALKDKKVCFGFSGNPVSCFLQFELLAKPFLLKSSGAHYQPSRIKSKLDGEFSRKKSDRQYFLPVLLSKNGYVTPVVYHGSAHLHALNEIIGFAEIPQGIKTINKGEEIYVRLV
jgi:molybdopterin molybdotransferase